MIAQLGLFLIFAFLASANLFAFANSLILAAVAFAGSVSVVNFPASN
jgi:hypothetical protein